MSEWRSNIYVGIKSENNGRGVAKTRTGKGDGARTREKSSSDNERGRFFVCASRLL
jgi:hypothetical protein